MLRELNKFLFLCITVFNLVSSTEEGSVFSKCKLNQVSSNIITREIKNAQISVWLKDAQFLARCFEKYGTKGENSSYVCDSIECQECLKPCQKGSFLNSADCKSKICIVGSLACWDGCTFYEEVYMNSTDEHLSPPIPNKIPERTGSLNSHNITLRWSNTSSKNASVFVLLKEEKGHLQPLLITTKYMANVSAAQICGDFGRFDFTNEKIFDVLVVPVNQHGWRRTLDIFPKLGNISFAKARMPKNLVIHEPPLYQQKNGKSPQILLNTTWDKDNDQGITGYVYKNIRHHCSAGGIILEQFTNNNAATVAVTNADDSVKGCKIEIHVTPVVSCLRGKTSTSVYYYRGCHTVLGYPHDKCEALKPTVGPTTVSYKLTSLNIECTEEITYNCTHSNCTKCTKIAAQVHISWSLTPNNSQVTKVKYRLFILKKHGVITFPFPVIDPVTVPVKITSVVFNLTETGKYKFGVMVLTNSEEPAWSSVNGTSFVIDFPKTVVPTTNTNISMLPPDPRDSGKGSRDLTIGLLLLVVVIFLLGIGILVAYSRKKISKDEIIRTPTVRFKKFEPPDSWEIHPSMIKLGHVIGEGAFGEVFFATIHETKPVIDNSSEFYVMSRYDQPMKTKGSIYYAAVKMLRAGATKEEKEDFLKEIELMKGIGSHKNIVNFKGCCTITRPARVVVEYLPYGDLLNYLKKRRSQIADRCSTDLHKSPIQCSEGLNDHENFGPGSLFSDVRNGSYLTDTWKTEDLCYQNELSEWQESLTPQDILSFSWQIACGMEYLSDKNFVHRDLAARNVLVGYGKVCKISDFGLTRDVARDQIYMSRKSRRLPIKWMALEAIICQEFTTMSDVWAYGVVLVEVVTLGGTPYPAIDNQLLFHKLKNGYRMEQPENCSDELYDIMLECWKENPRDRPTFTDIRETMEELIYRGTPYISFSFDESSPYYNVPSFKSLETDQISLTDLNLETETCTLHSDEITSTLAIDDDRTQENYKFEKNDANGVTGVDNTGFERYVSSRVV